MPQNAMLQLVGKGPANLPSPLLTDAEGALMVAGASKSALNITAATVVKTGPSLVYKLSVTTAGAAGTLSDCATTGAVAAANLVFTIPATVGVYTLDWPFALGIVVTPGAAQVVSLSYT